MTADPTQHGTIDDTARRSFESAWTDGTPRPIEECLPERDDGSYLPTLEELVQIELEFRWKRCRTRHDFRMARQEFSIERYVARFPALDAPDVLKRLIEQEYDLRTRYGDATTHDEYLARFPALGELAAELQRADERRTRLPEIPGYQLIEVLGRGAMAVAYRAQQHQPRRQVAMKMLLAGAAAGSEVVTRFRAEAEAIAQLQHPNIVGLYELGEQDGQLFLALELVDGGTLAGVIGGVPQPQRWSADLAATLADALQLAHDEGIVHRDLKPSNVLMTDSGQPKISDFGLAKCLEADATQTRTGELLGTPSYMAPEQARGDTRSINARTDVYALGAILYELLTGRPPFRGESTWDTVSLVLEQEPVAPRQLQPRIDRDLETICLKCLRKEPEQRYPSSAALADDLRRYLDGRAIVARRVGGIGRAWRWCRRRPAIATTVALSVVTIAAISTAAVYRIAEERDRYLIEREAAVSNLYDSLVREAQSLRLARQLGYRDEVWSRLREALALDTGRRDVAQLRDQAVACMGDFIGLDPQVWSAGSGRPNLIVAAAIHPDGERVALGLNGGTISIRQLTDGVEVARLAKHDSGVFEVAFSPDGRWLVSADDQGAMKAWRDGDGGWTCVQTITTRPSAQPNFVRAVSLAFTADSRQLFYAPKGASRVSRWDLAANVALEPAYVAPPNNPVWRFALDSHDRLLAVVLASEEVVLWDQANNQEVAKFDSELKPVFDVAFSPDARWLALGTAGGAVVYEVANQQRSLSILGDHLLSVAFSPDSRWLLLPSNDRRLVRIWDIGANREVAELPTPAYAALMTNDHQRLIAADPDQIHVVSLQGAELAPMVGHDRGVHAVAFSPDGRWMVSCDDVALKLHDLASGSVRRVEHGSFGRPKFDPTGTRLFTCNATTVEVLQFANGELSPLARLPHEVGPNVWSLELSDDGTRLGIAGVGGVQVWDVDETGEIASPRQLFDAHAGSLSINAVGDRLAWVDHHGNCYGWQAGEARPRQLPDIAGTNPGGTAFLDDRRVLIADVHGNVNLIDLTTSVSSHLLTGTKSWRKVHVATSPNKGRLLIQIDHRLSIWDARSHERLLTLPKQTALPWSSAWSNDGDSLAVGSANGEVHLWRLDRIRDELDAMGLGWDEPSRR